MIQWFDSEIAAKYGIFEAVLFQNICYWVAKNEANGKHEHDGRYWSYNSAKAFAKLFPYANPQKIRRALLKLESDGLIMIGNYNKSQYDQTKWYALSDYGKCIFQNQQIDFSKMKNGIFMDEKPIPNNNTEVLPNNMNTSYSPEQKISVSDSRRIIDAWNALPEGIPRLMGISESGTRPTNLKARINEYGIDEVIRAIEMIPNCDFLLGKVSDFKVTFDWFIKPTNFAKVIEGNYLNRKESQSGIGFQTGNLDEGEVNAINELFGGKRKF